MVRNTHAAPEKVCGLRLIVNVGRNSQGRGLDANRVTVMVVLATRRRLAPCWSADEQSQRPSHSCTRRVRVLWIHPTFQCQCELKKLGRAVQLLNSNVACSRSFLVSQSFTSWHRAMAARSRSCWCAEHQLRPLDRRARRLQPCSAPSARLGGKDYVPYGTRMCTLCSACICACAYMYIYVV